MSHQSTPREEPSISITLDHQQWSLFMSGSYTRPSICRQISLTSTSLNLRSINRVRLNRTDAQLVFSGALHTGVLNAIKQGHVLPSVGMYKPQSSKSRIYFDQILLTAVCIRRCCAQEILLKIGKKKKHLLYTQLKSNFINFLDTKMCLLQTKHT